MAPNKVPTQQQTILEVGSHWTKEVGRFEFLGIHREMRYPLDAPKPLCDWPFHTSVFWPQKRFKSQRHVRTSVLKSSNPFPHHPCLTVLI